MQKEEITTKSGTPEDNQRGRDKRTIMSVTRTRVALTQSEVATAEPQVDQMYSIGVDHGEWTGALLRARICVPRSVAKLYPLSYISQARLSEEGTCPFLQMH